MGIILKGNKRFHPTLVVEHSGKPRNQRIRMDLLEQQEYIFRGMYGWIEIIIPHADP